MYKLKQFWYRRLMWTWCFQCWYNLMFPHIVYPNCPERTVDNDTHWFWMYLNDFNGVYLDFDGEGQ